MGYVSAVPVPQPRARSANSSSTADNGRRSLVLALLLGALGAAVVLLTSGQTWAEGTAQVGGGTLALDAEGGDVTGVPSALAVVGLAALVAVFAVRRAGRVLVAAVLALSGAGAALAAFRGAYDSSALDAEAARTSGNASATIDALTHTAWPFVTTGAGVLILLAGVLALRYGRHWPSMSGRYEREASPRKATPPANPDRPEELWKALDRGEDPT
ncbi:TIGR02234 family membrane protein [Streptomyces sp. NPDC005963]|uniref:TIGR02234 family membrane protein n=1 Tax=Streptomyces sp. NPDC005963 TaxID=3156721 RepID=UPI0034038D73